MENLRYFIMIAASFLWVGFICAISFMETRLKFRAPGVTLPIGLSIGKLVFRALNKMEWAFAIIIVIGTLIDNGHLNVWVIAGYGAALSLLVTQTIWLLPALEKRADARISGKTLFPSAHHRYFIAAELGKVIALFLSGICLLKSHF
ncbi:MAG TPA: hypothetical protein VHC96_22265 [Puia sp.]|jgi:hypothetical protein|nr:hypothetical protein [Puia sp.]